MIGSVFLYWTKMQMLGMLEKLSALVILAVSSLLIFSTGANAFVGQGCHATTQARRNLSNISDVSDAINDIGNIIDSNRPLCLDKFDRVHPEAAEMANWVSQVTFPFYCDGGIGNAVYVTTKSQRILVSVSHIAVTTAKKNGHWTFVESTKLKHCYIVLKDGRHIDVNSKIPPISGITEKNPEPYTGRDFYVFSIDKPLKDVPTIPIANEKTKNGDRLYVESTGHVPSAIFGPNCETVVSCSSKVAQPFPGMSTSYSTDCSGESGTSGSPAVGESPDGRLELRGLQVSVTGHTGSTYDYHSNFSDVVGIDGPFRDAINQMDQKLLEYDEANRQ